MKKMGNILFAAFLALIIPLLLAVGFFVVSKNSSSTQTSKELTPIEKAAKNCGVKDLVEDNGDTIKFDTEGEEDYGGDNLADLECFFTTLKVPNYIEDRLYQTRAMDGIQEVSWDNYAAFWNYHPDDGLDITIYTQ